MDEIQSTIAFHHVDGMIQAYRKQMKIGQEMRDERSAAEKKDDEIKVKPIYAAGCGTKVDIYA